MFPKRLEKDARLAEEELWYFLAYWNLPESEQTAGADFNKIVDHVSLYYAKQEELLNSQ